MDKKTMSYIQLFLSVGVIPGILIYQIFTIETTFDVISIILFATVLFTFEIKTYWVYSLIEKLHRKIPKKIIDYYATEWVSIMKSPEWNLRTLLPVKLETQVNSFNKELKRINLLTHINYVLLAASIIFELFL